MLCEHDMLFLHLECNLFGRQVIKLYAYLTPDTGNTSNNPISSIDGQGNGELKEDIFTGIL